MFQGRKIANQKSKVCTSRTWARENHARSTSKLTKLLLRCRRHRTRRTRTPRWTWSNRRTGRLTRCRFHDAPFRAKSFRENWNPLFRYIHMYEQNAIKALHQIIIWWQYVHIWTKWSFLMDQNATIIIIIGYLWTRKFRQKLIHRIASRTPPARRASTAISTTPCSVAHVERFWFLTCTTAKR
jgi:hypothetical protein